MKPEKEEGKGEGSSGDIVPITLAVLSHEKCTNAEGTKPRDASDLLGSFSTRLGGVVKRENVDK